MRNMRVANMNLCVTTACFVMSLLACQARLETRTAQRKGEGAALTSDHKRSYRDCIDPNMKLVPSDQSFTLCDGSLGKGELDLTGLVAGNVAAATSIAGVHGNYNDMPEACKQDNETNCYVKDAFVAVDLGAFGPKQVQKGTSIAGVSGSIDNCTADGDKECFVTSPLRAANLGQVTAWDLRAGKTAAGMNGKLRYCTNTANLGLFDYVTAPAGVGLDPFDTIDDLNGDDSLSLLPPDKLLAWNGRGCGDNWSLYTTDGHGQKTTCSSAMEACVAKDELAGTEWSRPQLGGTDWLTALTICDDLYYNGRSDWRLPSAKEVIQAYINGIKVMTNAKFAASLDVLFWTSTTLAENITQAWSVNLATGYTAYTLKTSNTPALVCVRP